MHVLLIVFQLLTLGCCDELLYAINIWRHGDRAPARRFSCNESANSPIFHRGLGQLTDQGLQHAAELGQLLAERYRSTIRTPERVRVRSTIHNRTQTTAQIVLQQFFEDDSDLQRVKFVVGEIEDPLLRLNYLKCSILREIQQAKCPGTVQFSNEYAKSFENYEYDLWRCIGGEEDTKYFDKSRQGFSTMESVLNEYLNGFDFAGTIFTQNRVKEAEKQYRKVQRITLGIGDYHETNILKVYTGQLLTEIFEQLQSASKCFDAGNCTPMLQAYSSQDLQIFPLLEVFNVTEEAVGNGAPLYTSCLIIELYSSQDDGLYVKILYSTGPYPNRKSQLIDLTDKVPNCQGNSKCPLEQFLNCCNEYRSASNLEECNNFSGLQKRLYDIEKFTNNGIVRVPETSLSTSSHTLHSLVVLMIFLFVWE